VLARGITKIPIFEVIPAKPGEVGFTSAVKVIDPFCDGFHEHDAECDDPLPEVGTDTHPAMRLPLTRNVTFDATLVFKLMVVEDRNWAVVGFPESAKELIVGLPVL
jgi:hypothetical protein